ncbi:MAG: FecR domain-containing protein [Alphaproteobacteria bacterium]|nr:FecR domain-containing protein [Alphaproteobacteria bacterium]
MTNRLTNRMIAAFFTVLVLFFPALARADVIGTVVEIEGAATLSRAGGMPFALKLQDTIELGDVVATGEKSRLFILLADNTEWTLAENSRFKVDEYVFDSEDSSKNRARYSVLRGGFRYVSGLVAKKENPDVGIDSPAGTIGIRGTDITVAPDTDGSYDVYVDDGQIDVSSGGNTARLQRGQGTMIAKRNAAPLAPKDWKQGRLQRLRERLKLARGGELQARIQNMQPRQMELRKALREKIMQKRGGGNENLKQQREQKQELRKEKAAERKAETEERRAKAEERREKWNEKLNDDDAATPADKARLRLQQLQQRRQKN